MFDVGIGEMNSCQTKWQFMAAYSGRDCSLWFLRLWWPCERASRHPRGGSPRRRSRHSRTHPRRCSRRKSAAARPASAAADAAAADERPSDGETWGAMISRDGFFLTMRTIRDGKRGTPIEATYYLSSPSWHPPASRAAQAGTQNELIRTMNHPPASCVYHAAPSRVPTRPQRGCRVAEGVSTSFFATGFSAILEGIDAISGRARGIARLATTFESTGHAASVLRSLVCNRASPVCENGIL